MPAPTDPSIWRTHPYVFETLLWVDKPPVVFACRVNQAITANSFPIADITYDGVTTGVYTDCWAHQLVLFGSAPGLDDLGRGRLRKAPNATTLFIGRSSQGIHDGECNIVDDSYLTVLDTFLPWARVPWVADGITQNGASVPLITTQYRDWDLDYTEGINGHPQVNLGYGPGFLGEVDPATNLLTVSFPLVSGLSKGYDSNIVSWTVTAPDGSQSGSVPNITYTFPPGRRHVHFTATDANGNSLTRHILVVAAKDGTAFEAIKYFEMTNQKLDLDGNKNQCSITVYQSIPASTYIDKAMVIVAENEWYGSTQGPINVVSNLGQTGSETIKFCGWMYDANNSTVTNSDGTLNTVILTCYDVCGWLDKLPGFPIEINRMLIVTSWLQQKNANIDKYLAESIALYFSTIRYITDFFDTNTGDMYGISRLGSGQQTLYATFQEFADRAIGYEFTANEQGMIQIHPNQNLLPANLRTAINILTVTEDDLISIDHTDIRHPRNHWNRGAAIVASTADITSIVTPQTAFAVAPGKGPGQGPTEKDSNEQLVISPGELFTREAGRAAEDNSSIGDIRLKFGHVGDAGIEPAAGQWLTINISAQYAAQRGIQFTNVRTRILAVTPTRTASPDGNVKELEAICRPETFGVAAVDDTPSISNVASAPQGSPPPPTISTTTNPYNARHDGTSVIAHDASHIALGNYYTTGGRWRLAPMSGLSGLLQQLKLDPFATFLSPSKSGTLPAYMQTTTGLFYITDILDSTATWTHKQVLSVASSNPASVTGCIRPSSTVPGDIYMAYYDGSADADQAYRFSGNGGTIVGYNTFASGPYQPGNGCGMDIDNYGADEMIISVRNASFTFAVYQILNGSVPTRLTANISQTLCYFVQKPLLTFAGSPNSSTGGSECFIFISAGDQHLLKTANGGVTVTDITPPGSGGCALLLTSISSLAFTANSNVIAVVGNNGKIYTTQNGGATWTTGATFVADLYSATLGYYPTSVSGSYALYGGGFSGMFYSPDFGQSIINATGDWLTSIGTISGRFLSVIPLY